ncbi:MAG: DUF4129 domain-containing protein [Pirellulales bacterium]|jgi:hypothetical protein
MKLHTMLRLICILSIYVFIALGHPHDSLAQRDTPVESGKRALQRDTPFPWYDEQHDVLKRIPLDTEWIQRLRERLEQSEQSIEEMLEGLENMDLGDMDLGELPPPDMEDFGADFDSESFLDKWEEYIKKLGEEAEANSGGNGRANPNSPQGNGSASDGGLDPSSGNSSAAPPAQRSSEWTPDLNFLGGGGAFVEIVFWGILVVLAIGVVGLIVWSIINREQTNKDPGLTSRTNAVTEEERLEELPVQLDPAFKNLLDRVRECYDNGDYNQAIVYLFSYKLIQLDKKHLIHLTRGKTNHQYLREVTGHSQLQDTLRLTVRAFEDVFFGNHDLTKSRFQQCWDNVDIFRALSLPTPTTGAQV